jgi:hypothetical protein
MRQKRTMPTEPSTASVCRFDVGHPDGDVVGCSPDRPEEWTSDHFHRLINGVPCECRHGHWRDAAAEHGEG